MTVAQLLASIENGDFPRSDGGATLLPQPNPEFAAVISVTGHVYVIADISPQWLADHLRPGDLSGAFTPPFLGALANHLGRRVSAIDMLVVARADIERPGLDLDLAPIDLAASERGQTETHPRIARAHRYRSDVRAWSTVGGVLVLGKGFAGRWEVAIEVDESHQGRGIGRRLAVTARRLIPADAALWAQIAPGNAASVRAFLAAGYRPVGQEALLVRGVAQRSAASRVAPARAGSH